MKILRPSFLLCSIILCSATPIFCQTLESEHIQYLGSWGEKGKKQGQFRDPQAISTDPAGFIYVADTGNHRLQKFSPEGVFIVEIGGFGWRKEQFDSPVDLSARNGLDVFVADQYNARIERYDKDLHYLASLGSLEEWPENLQFGFPKGVDISSQGELIVLEGENDRVLKLDILGNPQRSFGDFDAGSGRLLQPQRLIVSPGGRIFVTDLEPARIVEFDIHGNFISETGGDLFSRPCGLAVFDSDHLLVTDTDLGQVVILERLRVIHRIDGKRGVGFRFEEPVDVATWRDRIYVLDKQLCSIHIFRWTPGLEKDRG